MGTRNARLPPLSNQRRDLHGMGGGDVYTLSSRSVIVAAPWKEKCLSHLYNAHVDMQNTASITNIRLRCESIARW